MTATSTDIRRAASPAETTADGRPLALINTRESDEHNRLLFDGMREQTYAMLSDIPAVAAVQKLGLAPLDPGRESIVVRAEGPFGVVEREVVIHRLQVGSTRAILFGFMGYYHLWSPWQAARLQTAMFDNVDKVSTGVADFHLTGPNAQTGLVLFSTLAMAAAMERDWIVQRTLTGRVWRASQGRWPFGKVAVPFGYKWDAKKRCPVPDRKCRKSVRAMMMILCTD